MTDILNTVAEYYGRFIPSKPSEYLALQIARKLSDGTAFRHYLVLFERYPLELILRAYEQCAQDGRLTGDQFMLNFRTLTN
jgi:hypothetical protein